jgi:hypothetical protein
MEGFRGYPGFSWTPSYRFKMMRKIATLVDRKPGIRYADLINKLKKFHGVGAVEDTIETMESEGMVDVWPDQKPGEIFVYYPKNFLNVTMEDIEQHEAKEND